ncbi:MULTISPECIES: hypothetical protein [Methylobacterium]|uniref:Anti-sigma factor NepR domain-containing protein n=1 Tax=Methylobacterium jeotgali TaxID=381630 RepID=A0ABQ4SZ28_9HYPH|nr:MULTISPECIES: hypothetical protein [Methylobacterium]PIU06777.1 MAG: hypothetical protein COT56_08230 [Methylobacterium sp. CG09_land_8_20_14_0_10_71_15]GBU17958.1 hypothetical protein AwMethylo_21730 [Methylobacterium sp.]GJE07471.1 hypothetical protein AOPFMNJM_2800 [Methylobacterium jeotgali]
MLDGRKTSPDRAPAAKATGPGLAADVRRHLGETLKDAYAGRPPEPVDARLKSLIERLDGAKR